MHPGESAGGAFGSQTLCVCSWWTRNWKEPGDLLFNTKTYLPKLQFYCQVWCFWASDYCCLEDRVSIVLMC